MANKATSFAGDKNAAAPSRGRFVNSGNGPTLMPIDIGHDDYSCVIGPDTAFWSLVKHDKLHLALTRGKLIDEYNKKAASFASEMQSLRFGLKPSAVYFNPTEKCNLNCSYCYIPADMRAAGRNMPEKELLKALEILKKYFKRTVPPGHKPQIVFHGAEPLLNRDAMFAGIEKYLDDFRFGIQTNSTLLDESAVDFLTSRNVSIGLSLDAHSAPIADRTRKTWSGDGVFAPTVAAMRKLEGYHAWSVICTVTSENMRHLSKLVDFLHRMHTPTCLLNIVRCTLPPSRNVKPGDAAASKHFLNALDRTHELFLQTGRKLPVANFANILLSILAPAARRLMCDISPCGGGRCFFALATDGGLYPCSEFIGAPAFNGGNIFTDKIPDVLNSNPFKMVTERKVEDIDPCNRCAIRHFCGSPCPAEAHEMNGGMHKTGAFCEFYEEQVRYAFRLIADGKHEDFLWDAWDRGTVDTFSLSGF